MADDVTLPATGTGDATPKMATKQRGSDSAHLQEVIIGDGAAQTNLMTVNASNEALVHTSGTVGISAGAAVIGHVIADTLGGTSLISGTVNVAGTVPVSGTVGLSGTVPTVAGTVAAVTAAWTSATSDNTTLALPVSSYGCVLVSINPVTTTGGTISFEASDDGGTTWYSVQGIRQNALTLDSAYGLNGAAAQVWQVDVTGFTNFHAKLHPQVTGSGTATVRMQAVAAEVDTGQVVTVSGTVPVSGTFWQATQPISGTVGVSGTVPISGTVGLAAGTQLIGQAAAIPGVAQIVDSAGAVHAIGGTWANVAASTTDGTVVPLSGSTKTYIWSIAMYAGTATTNVTVNGKPSGLGTALGPLFAFPANGGIVLPFCGAPWFQSAASSGISVTTGAGGSVGVLVTYSQY